MEPTRIYDYLLASRERLFDAVRRAGPDGFGRPFPFGLRTLGVTLTHMMNAEWYYLERIEGREVPPYESWPVQDERPPALDELERRWRGQGDRVRAVLGGVRDWSRRVAWIGFPDDQGRRFRIAASVGDLVTQLVLHEVHHRAQAMVMLRELGSPLEDVDFNATMFERVPVGG